MMTQRESFPPRLTWRQSFHLGRWIAKREQDAKFPEDLKKAVDRHKRLMKAYQDSQNDKRMARNGLFNLVGVTGLIAFLAGLSIHLEWLQWIGVTVAVFASWRVAYREGHIQGFLEGWEARHSGSLHLNIDE